MKRWMAGILAAGALVALAGPARAARIGVDPARFSMAYLRSDQTECYWSAALEQILRYYGLDIKQAKLARSVFGANPDGSTRSEAGGSIDDAIDKALKALSVDEQGRKFTVAAIRWPNDPHHYTLPQAPSARVLQAELSAGRPILALCKRPEGQQYLTGAASQMLVDIVIIDAADIATDADGNPSIKSVEFRNPEVTAKNPKDAGFVTFSPTEYKARISTYWTIQVKR